MSNTERQRQFRLRNPGYYQRLHARRKVKLDEVIRAKQFAAADASGVPEVPAEPHAAISTTGVAGINLP